MKKKNNFNWTLSLIFAWLFLLSAGYIATEYYYPQYNDNDTFFMALTATFITTFPILAMIAIYKIIEPKGGFK